MHKEIVAFLRERLQEDAQIARAAAEEIRCGDETASEWAAGYAASCGYEAAEAHIMHWLPARVRAELLAKHHRVELHAKTYTHDWPDALVFYACYGCEQPAPCPSLRLEAAAYAWHADYDKEWKP